MAKYCTIVCMYSTIPLLEISQINYKLFAFDGHGFKNSKYIFIFNIMQNVEKEIMIRVSIQYFENSNTRVWYFVCKMDLRQ